MTMTAIIARAICRIEVDGPSMEPTLLAGDRIIVRRTKKVKVGNIVVVADPTDPAISLIKRVISISGQALTIEGDNRGASRDSREFGPIAMELVQGRAVYRYFPASERGRLR